MGGGVTIISLEPDRIHQGESGALPGLLALLTAEEP